MFAAVVACEPLGPYLRVTLERTFPPGEPGQFHMLRPLAYDGLLARPLSAVAADDDGVTFLTQPRGAGLAALARVGAGVEVLGPFGHGFDARAAGAAPLLVGGGFGAALLAPLARVLPAAVLLAAFRDAGAARAAELVEAAEREIVLPPASVLDGLARRLDGATCVLAAGPDGLVRAIAAACATAGVPCQVALEAPMACGYGACYGCAVSLGGKLVRLCVEGPVVAGDRLGAA
ncbi:MAG: dihydroorotate dehydrogenase electron transfer subunit [Gaiellales bacterium]|jgi:dihydroorotate dehydrogenase electron transfer subunit|nr:dihydroorotate dehydrogenase electron transfer subunit [Gaiellales bacterium]